MASVAGAGAYLPLRDLAVYSGLSVRTLRSHLVNPSHPLPNYRIGGKILVRRSEFDAWAQHFRGVANAADVGAVVDEVVNSLLW